LTDKVLCFDLGWTLEDETDSQNDRNSQIAAICKKSNFEVSGNEIAKMQRIAGKTGIPSVHKFAVEHLGLPLEIVELIKKETKWNTDCLKLYPDAIHTLEALYKKYELLIIANQSRPIDARLQAYGIRHFFTDVICSCDAGYNKPDIRIFEIAENKFKNKDVEFWMIGDRIDNDIVPAKVLGWKTIRILQGDHMDYAAQGACETPDFTIRNLSEIIQIAEKRIAFG